MLVYEDIAGDIDTKTKRLPDLMGLSLKIMVKTM